MPATPHPSCSGVITKLIEALYAIRSELRARKAGHIESGLSLAVALQDANPEGLDASQKVWRNHFLDDSSFKTRSVRQLLDDLIAVDPHLKSCCRSAWGLARAIEVLSPIALQAMDRSWDEGGQEAAVGRMLTLLYESDYQRETYIHIYNLDLEQPPLPIPTFSAEFVRLEPGDLPRLIGEATFTSALHDSRTGTCFVRFVDNKNDDDNSNFQNCWMAAYTIMQILKYLQYGIVDLDYGGIYYRPTWINEVMRFGIRIWGLPRKDHQKAFYLLTKQNRQKFESYCNAYLKLKPLIEDVSTSLRQATALAGDYFEGHHKRTKPEEKLVDLVIALEILFSPSREGELRFRIAQRAAILLGKTPAERISIKDFILRIYDARSGLVHAGESPFSAKAKKKLTNDDLARLADYVRQAMLRLITLRWRGETEKDRMQATLDHCALDQSAQDTFLTRSDFESALPEILAS